MQVSIVDFKLGMPFPPEPKGDVILCLISGLRIQKMLPWRSKGIPLGNKQDPNLDCGLNRQFLIFSNRTKQKSDVYLVMAYIQLKFIIYLVPFHNVCIRNRLPFSVERTFYLDHSLSMSILENNRICDNRIGIVESFMKKVLQRNNIPN